MGANMPPNVQWKTMSGEFVIMTAQLVQQIFSGFLQKELTVYAIAEQHKTNMLASQTPDTYDYSSGWPAIYVE